MRTLGLFGLFLAAATSAALAAAPGAPEPCAALASLHLEHATVTAATLVTHGAGLALLRLKPDRTAALKDFCRVQLLDQPSADSHILTEVWLPATAWNGRYAATGNGGFAGEIYFEQMAANLDNGYITSGTDTGHAGVEPTFALGHPEKIKDFGWRAMHDMAQLTRQVALAFYGKPIQHAYLTACSDGGREALMEAQRFPADFDGILAGAPAYNWTGLLASGAVNEAALHATPASYLPARKLPALAAAVRNACDAQDGVRDGILNDPRDCHFDPAALLCKSGDADTCLLPEQIASLNTIYGPKVDSAGDLVFPGISRGSEDAPNGLVPWVTGSTPADHTLIGFFSQGYFSDFVYQQPNWSTATFNLDRDYAKARATTSQALDATDTNLKPFTDRGGKLILYHGWNDPAIAPLSTIAYYDAVSRTPSANAVRLYLVPGMLHCAGGPGATSFGVSDDPDQPDTETPPRRRLPRHRHRPRAMGRSR